MAVGGVLSPLMVMTIFVGAEVSLEVLPESSFATTVNFSSRVWSALSLAWPSFRRYLYAPVSLSMVMTPWSVSILSARLPSLSLRKLQAGIGQYSICAVTVFQIKLISRIAAVFQRKLAAGGYIAVIYPVCVHILFDVKVSDLEGI